MEEDNSPPQRKSILYRGHYYDVTDFIPRHPGGEEVISFYVNSGEDASHVIEQLHFRSEKKVLGILKSFKKRKATEAELMSTVGNQEKYERNQAMTEDFAKLFHELKEEGLFEPSFFHAFHRLFEVSVLGLLGLHLFLNLGYKWLGTVFMWVCGVRSTYLGHESGHSSLTGKPWLDKLIQGFYGGIQVGLSGASWRHHHYKHHAMTQHLHHDVDLNTLPIMAFHEKVVTDRKEFSFLVKHQKWLIYIIQSNVVGFWWKLVDHPLYCLKHGYWWDLFWITVHNAVLIPILGLQWYILISSATMTMVFINATLSHTHLPVTVEPTHWVEASFVHTANITPSLWMNWYTGYLNYQIEHHLFPTMPQFKNPLITGRVKALAKKYGLPYQIHGWWRILKLTLDNLGKVSEQVDHKFREKDQHLLDNRVLLG